MCVLTITRHDSDCCAYQYLCAVHFPGGTAGHMLQSSLRKTDRSGIYHFQIFSLPPKKFILYDLSSVFSICLLSGNNSKDLEEAGATRQNLSLHMTAFPHSYLPPDLHRYNINKNKVLLYEVTEVLELFQSLA